MYVFMLSDITLIIIYTLLHMTTNVYRTKPIDSTGVTERLLYGLGH